ncbi:MAG: ATP-binding protein [Cyanophyceae cyanobacterium]
MTSLYQQAASLLLYQSVFDDQIGAAFLSLLESLAAASPQPIRCLQAYGHWFRSLAIRHRSWSDYLVTRILLDDNPFSQQVQTVAVDDLPASLVTAAKRDLQILQSLSRCPQQLSQQVQEISELPTAPVAWELGSSLNLLGHQPWPEAVAELAQHYRHHGTGIFAQYAALRWQRRKLVGIAHPDSVQLANIIGYDSQKELLLRNTEFLLAGYPALHVLLYGSRGSGKSSLVKGLLPQYQSCGLRLIEVSKSELQDLPEIVEQLRVPQKFIIFVDDLSFEEDDEAFKALKVVLEGSLTAKAANVVVYATSNRRHLVREFFADRPRPRDSDEVHRWDTMQEKLSFSDRFGLTLTFESANQDTYLEIVRHLAQQAQLPFSPEELEFRAKQWATRHNGRSGRTARQFIDFLQAEVAHQPPLPS